MAELGDFVYFEKSVENGLEGLRVSNYTADLSQVDGDVSIGRLGDTLSEALAVRGLGWTRLGFYMSVDSFSQEDMDISSKANPSKAKHMGSHAVGAETFFGVAQPLTMFRSNIDAIMTRPEINSQKLPHLFATINSHDEKGLFIASEYDSDWLLNKPNSEDEGISELQPSLLYEGVWNRITLLRDTLNNLAAESLRS